MRSRPLARLTRTVALALGALSIATLAGPASAATAMPTHVFAPYFEAWTTDSMTGVANASGAKYFTMAFIQTPKKGSCTR